MTLRLSDSEQQVFPESLTVSLVKVLLEPSFGERTLGDPDPLLLRVARICSRKLSGARYELLLGDLCGRFSGRRARRGLRDREVKAIREAADGLSLLSPPYLVVESYPFGLTSYRVTSNFKPIVEDQSKLLESWRRISRVFTSIINSRMPEHPKSLTSKFFSEVYAFYECDVDPIYLRKLWPELEGSLVPGRSEVAHFLSPLKTASGPRSFELGWIPDPSYASSDGLLVRFLYSRTREGKRRCVHATRRKKRRIHRIAVDHVLGLKVFLDNQDLWIRDPETLWGAFVGMIYLNPEVLAELWKLTGRRFVYAYEHLLDQFDLRERFESYEELFWFPFRSDMEIALFLDAVRMLGGSPPRAEGPYSLNNLELDALKLLIVKSQLDSLLMPLDDAEVLYLSKYLCEFLRSHSEALARMSLASSDECVNNLYSHMSSRNKRRGLTYLELAFLLTPIYGERAWNALVKSSSLLSKLSGLGLIEEGIDFRRRVMKRGDRTVRGFRVRFYVPSDDELVKAMGRRLIELSQRAGERIRELSSKGPR